MTRFFNKLLTFIKRKILTILLFSLCGIAVSAIIVKYALNLSGERSPYFTIPYDEYNLENFPFDLPMDISIMLKGYPDKDKEKMLAQTSLLRDIQTLISELLRNQFGFIKRAHAYIMFNETRGMSSLTVSVITSSELEVNEKQSISDFINRNILGVPQDRMEILYAVE